MGSGQTNLPTTSWIPPIIPMVGSSSQHRASHTTSEPTMCGHVWHRPIKHFSGHSPVPCLVSRSPPCLRRHPPALRLSSSACSCFTVSGSPSLSLLAPAGVASHSILVAPTVQRARERKCWGVGVSPWRAPLRGFAGKPGPGSRQTSWSGIWTCLSLRTMHEGWRWSRMACLSSGRPSWG